MPRYCFNWSLVGSTIIEADDIYAAREQWDRIESNTALLATASSVDFSEDETMVETSPGCFDDIEGEAGDYIEYCAAKRDIGEEPLSVEDWRDFSASAES